MMASASASNPVPPQVLLAHHLQQLKLPTFLREYEKLAAEAAREGLDHVRFLLRLAELELIDRHVRSSKIGCGAIAGKVKVRHAYRGLCLTKADP